MTLALNNVLCKTKRVWNKSNGTFLLQSHITYKLNIVSQTKKEHSFQQYFFFTLFAFLQFSFSSISFNTYIL